MLVYGDHHQRLDPREQLAAIEQARQHISALPPGLQRHSALTGLFIDLAGVIQGVADARFTDQGHDSIIPEERMLMQQLVDVAEALLLSWDGGTPTLAPVHCPSSLPSQIQVRVPEGYAFYALYPEAYALAARQLKLTGPAKVVALRSIGTGLGAIVAATLCAPAPITLRPVGHPFERKLALSPSLAADLLDEVSHYVIVDEGPGLSGSSFGCVADWLEEQGVAPDRIAFLPGHAGELGPQASARHQQRWRTAQRPVTSIDQYLQGWVEDLVGRLDGPLQDVSGGQWRPLWSASEASWPPVNPTWERRKFLARSGDETWLVKFAGLGRIGEEKLALAQHLQEAGFGPDVAGLAHGWLVQRWHEDAAPTRPSGNELARYLRFRSFMPAQQGASLSDLLIMARHNAPVLGAWSPDVDALQDRVRPVRIDGRMATHEWLRLRSGQLLKADALDHHASHDLVGCQDLAWDLAGAAVELGLATRDVLQLQQRLAIDPDLLAFSLPAYIAFRIGAHRMSESMLGHWPEEQARHGAAAAVLEARLSALVDAVEYARDIA
jgi:hypothetical protein